MIPFDTKNYRARNNNMFSTSEYLVIGIFVMVMILGWMGERDREAHVKRVQEAAAAQCEGGK